MNTVEKTINKLEEIERGRQKEKARLEERVEQAQAKIQEANEKMKQATAEDNEAMFMEAANAAAFSKSIIPVVRQQIEDLRTPSEEMKKLYEELKIQVGAETSAIEKKVAKLLKEVIDKAKEVDSMMSKANDILPEKERQSKVLKRWENEIITLAHEITRRKGAVKMAKKETELYSMIEEEEKKCPGILKVK